ncbi:MAG: FAD-dependent monooxygenase, partial [Pseudomonadota bacterium]
MKTAPFSAHTYDLAIIGGGVVGASLAIAAGDAGFDTLLLDASPLKSNTSDDFDGRAFSISIGCWRMWRVVGVADALEKTAQPIVGVQAESELGRRLIIDQSDTNTAEEPLGYMVEHRHIQRTLDEALAARDSITVRRGAPLTHLDVANGVVRVGSSDFRAEARIIVGCDGANSAVRSASGIRLHGHDYAATALAASVQLENDHQGAARQVFLKTGPLAVLPLPDNRANIIWTEPKDTAETLEAMRDQDFEAELRLRAGDFIGPFELIGHRFAYPLSLRMAESF